LKSYPSFFNENDSLRKFLDAGAADILLEVKDTEEYKRALDAVSIKSKIANLIENLSLNV